MIAAMADAQGFDTWTRRSTTWRAGIAACCSTARGPDGLPRRRRRGCPFSFQYKGLFPAIEEAGRVSFVYRMRLSGMVENVACSGCMGGRLRDDAAAVRFRDFTLEQVGNWPLGRALEFFDKLNLKGDDRQIAGDLVREIRDRLRFLVDVGLDY
ncbi:MAG: hypothetical protein U0800_15725 [Isosphaeraceae bacterium]